MRSSEWLAFACVVSTACGTNTPIIGILAQEVYPVKETHKSYMAASYVKAVEGAGARVAPIAINKTQDYYVDILSKINGVVFPGGGVTFTDPGGYGDAGTYILNAAKKMNDAGVNFPILGVCLGYELLMFDAAGSYDVLTNCQSRVPATLHFQRGYRKSQLYRKMPKCVVKTLQKLLVTANYHRKCVTIETLKKNKLTRKWRVLTTSKDENQLEFVSSSESVNYPFVGLQFHPEKNAYEWSSKHISPHSQKAVHSARYFYDWVVSQARLNNNSFQIIDEEKAALIYNYNVTYLDSSFYEQVYYFSV